MFGHSYGALIAYAVAQELSRSGGPAAARTPPHLAPLPRADQLESNKELVEVMRHIGLDDRGILSHPGLSHLFMKTLRSDLCENAIYPHQHDTALPCPITALSGSDDPAASHDQMAEWHQHSAEGFRHYRMPGAHFFLTEKPDDVIQLIADEME